MSNKLGNTSRTRHKNNDEIDLIEILVKVMRWKWFIAAFITVVTVSTFFFTLLSPASRNTYTVNSSLWIGTVGTYLVQSPDMITNSVKTELYKKARQMGDTIDDKTPLINPTAYPASGNNPQYTYHFDMVLTDSKGQFVLKLNFSASNKSIDFSVQTPSAEESVKWARMIGDFIIYNHRPLYANAVRQAQTELADLRKMSVNVGSKYIDMKIQYENQKYPTSYIIEPFSPSGPDAGSGKKMALKTGIAFMGSLIAGIFLSFLFDILSGIRTEIKKRLNTTRKSNRSSGKILS